MRTLLKKFKRRLEIINCATKISDKAMTTLLWNADARIREVGTLRIKHIKFDERGANLRKTLHYGFNSDENQ